MTACAERHYGADSGAVGPRLGFFQPGATSASLRPAAHSRRRRESTRAALCAKIAGRHCPCRYPAQTWSRPHPRHYSVPFFFSSLPFEVHIVDQSQSTWTVAARRWNFRANAARCPPARVEHLRQGSLMRIAGSGLCSRVVEASKSRNSLHRSLRNVRLKFRLARPRTGLRLP
jgi:hypothetical protein